jgi:hypothetical protein
VDQQITLGNIITIATTVFTVASGVAAVLWKLSQQNMQLSMVWKWFSRQHDINGDSPVGLGKLVVRQEVIEMVEELEKRLTEKLNRSAADREAQLKESRSYIHGNVHWFQNAMQVSLNRQSQIWHELGKPEHLMPEINVNDFKPPELK